MDHLYHEKNLYVMNNNGARNRALSIGRQMGAKWIMPFDGNCFLTASAWTEIRTTLLNSTNKQFDYYVVPMVMFTQTHTYSNTPTLGQDKGK